MPQLLATKVKVVDFQCRLPAGRRRHVRAMVRRKTTPDAERLGKVVYGLPELFREQIVQSQFVANPGCYPTSAILPLTPLVKAGLIEPTDIIVDSKSGVSGAGPSAKINNPFPRVQ